MKLKNDEERDLWKKAYVAVLKGYTYRVEDDPDDAAICAERLAAAAVADYRGVRGER